MTEYAPKPVAGSAVKTDPRQCAREALSDWLSRCCDGFLQSIVDDDHKWSDPFVATFRDERRKIAAEVLASRNSV